MNSVKKLCNSCGKSIATSQIARHQASHEVNFQCVYCSMSFNRKDSYKRHLNLHGNKYSETIVEPNLLPMVKFTIDDKKVIDNLVNFQVVPPNIPLNNKTPDFIHPFTCKVMGPRGSGKTSFTVSYIEQIASLTFGKIFIVTGSPDQPLYIKLKENSQIFFIALDELDSVIKSNRDILIVLDDVMKETRFSHTLETLYTRGRHQHISIMSLEQDMFYSNHIERRNADYFILTRIRDTSCLEEFYKTYCRDIAQWLFIELYEIAIKPALGFIIIDFMSHQFKYRINSLNTYYSTEHGQMRYILGQADKKLVELNAIFINNRSNFLNRSKNANNCVKTYAKPYNQHALPPSSIDNTLEAVTESKKTYCFTPVNQQCITISELMAIHSDSMRTALLEYRNIRKEFDVEFVLYIKLCSSNEHTIGEKSRSKDLYTKTYHIVDDQDVFDLLDDDGESEMNKLILNCKFESGWSFDTIQRLEMKLYFR